MNNNSDNDHSFLKMNFVYILLVLRGHQYELLHFIINSSAPSQLTVNTLIKRPASALLTLPTVHRSTCDSASQNGTAQTV